MSVTEPEQPAPLGLSMESGETRFVLEPMEAMRLRDGLRRQGGTVQERLATIIDAKAIELLAAREHAGAARVRMDRQEHDCLLVLLRGWSEDGALTELGSGSLHGLLAAFDAAG